MSRFRYDVNISPEEWSECARVCERELERLRQDRRLGRDDISGYRFVVEMSYCEEKGKDKIIFLTKEDADPSTSTIKLQDDPSDAPVGLITPEGDINWSCPCLGGMAVGPCGPDFREAFECFHYRYGSFS